MKAGLAGAVCEPAVTARVGPTELAVAEVKSRVVGPLTYLQILKLLDSLFTIDRINPIIPVSHPSVPLS
jgi:hypothetical protein